MRRLSDKRREELKVKLIDFLTSLNNQIKEFEEENKIQVTIMSKRECEHQKTFIGTEGMFACGIVLEGDILSCIPSKLILDENENVVAQDYVFGDGLLGCSSLYPKE
ncbi:MAG: hypothetical protein AB7O47_09095 [Flavobacteriales bacterium]